MEDKKFLHWLKERIVNVYGENKNIDFVQKLNGIINNYPEGKISNPSFEEKCDNQYQELRNSIIQLIHHNGYGVGNSAVATLLRELGDYYDD